MDAVIFDQSQPDKIVAPEDVVVGYSFPLLLELIANDTSPSKRIQGCIERQIRYRLPYPAQQFRLATLITRTGDEFRIHAW